MRISDWSSDVCSSDLMQHEAAPRFDRTAAQDGSIRNVAGLDVEALQQIVQADAVDLVADGDSQRSVLVMDAHGDDGMIEPHVLHSRQGEDRKSTRLNSSHSCASRMPSSP